MILSVESRTDATGNTCVHTNEFTLLENALNYQDDSGQWRESEDLVESFPDGAIAQRGPHKAIFSPDLNSPAVFDLQSSDGSRIAGGLRALQLTDSATGQTIAIATVKKSASGKLLPPNQILFEDSMDGLSVDVLLTWKHNAFSQDVILLEHPALPLLFAPATTRLEIVTEFVAAPDAEVRSGPSKPGGGANDDDWFIGFGKLSIVPGSAFMNESGDALALGAFQPGGSGKHVIKSWQRTEDGRTFLVESIAWSDIAADLEKLRLGARKNSAKSKSTVALQGNREALSTKRLWPARVSSTPEKRPIALAQKGYEHRGFVLDFVIVPYNNITSFQAGTTYYIQSYFAANNFTFAAGCVLKYKNAAYLLCYSSVSMPSSGEAVFTSRNDDLFGEKITGVSGETDSNGDPTLHLANAAISFYYPSGNTEVKYGHFRWMKHGLQYDVSTSYTSHTVHDCAFEHIIVTGASGIYLSTMPNTSLALSSTRKCNVATEFSGSSNHSGSMTDNCGVVNASYDASDTGTPKRAAGSQGEPAIAVRVNPNDSTKVQIAVAAIHKTGVASSGLLLMVSNDSGTTWSNAVIADATDSLPKADTDNDPALTFDKFGNLFLLYRSHPSDTVFNTVLLVSSDGGATWSAVKSFDGAGGGMPRVATTHSGSQRSPGSVWVSYIKGDAIYARGTQVSGLGSGNISSNWTSETAIRSSNCQNSFSSLAVGPNGEVLVSYVIGSGTSYNSAPVTCYFALDSDGLSTGGFQDIGSFGGINLDWQGIGPALGATPYPTLAWDWVRDKVYVVYADRASGTTGDDANIYVRYPTSRGTTWTWSSQQQVNDDSGTRSQFHPWISVDQDSGKVGVCWYDCRDDSSNVKASLYAAISTDAFSTVPPRNFRLASGQSQENGNGDFKEYIGGFFFKGFFHPVWADNSNSTGNNPDGTTGAMDIYICRFAY